LTAKAGTLEVAIELAARAHAGQVDKTGRPYILHPIHLMMQMETEQEMITAVLHDVVEDTPVDFDQLVESGFSAPILDALRLLTHSPSMPYQEYIAAIKENPLARRVKLADLAHNMDVRRLPAPLSAKDLERLQKYAHAWALLTE
jgi:(p)ppGpp synthase/HD superfamily hydrolase